MTDFSRHGIGFISNEKSSLHKRIEVHFDVPNSIKQPTIIPFKFMAEIKHCISTQDNECHIGVRLETPSAEYMRIFDSLSPI
jgi:hypothetical protein